MLVKCGITSCNSHKTYYYNPHSYTYYCVKHARKMNESMTSRGQMILCHLVWDRLPESVLAHKDRIYDPGMSFLGVGK
jgi:hypothetical protein